MAQPTRSIYKVNCPCGADLAVNGRSIDQPQKCNWCGADLKISIVEDPRTGKRTATAAAVSAAPPPRKAAPQGITSLKIPTVAPAKTGKTTKIKTVKDKTWPRFNGELRSGMYVVACTCGAEVKVEPRFLDHVQTCGACGTSFKVVPAAAKKKTERNVSAAAPSIEPSRSSVFTAPQMGAQELVLEKGIYNISCFCGAQNKINAASLDRTQTCFWCRGQFMIHVAGDPSTGKQLALTVPVNASGASVGSPSQIGHAPKSAPLRPLVPIPAAPRAPVAAPAKPAAATLDVQCKCGALLGVRRDQIGKDSQCPSCGAVLRIERAGRDAKQNKTALKIKIVRKPDDGADLYS